MSQPLEKFSLSSEVLNFYPSQTCSLTMTNVHDSYNVAFKIKTTKQHAFDVKPPKGIVKAGESVTVNFKASGNILQNQKDMNEIQRNQKFLLEVINLEGRMNTKDDVQSIWRLMKEKKTDLELLGYGFYKIPIQLTENPAPYDGSHLKKPEATSIVKTGQDSGNKMMNSLRESAFNIPEKGATDQQLSQKFQELRNEEEKLVERRQKIFAPSAKAAGKKESISFKTIIICLIMILIGFLMGNFLRKKYYPRTAKVLKRRTYWEKAKNYVGFG